ncbi:MAG: hypothetical protein VB071_11815 [Lawsonibacter sp.]|nr:hypothetical protein [Lawsonibacter sp.]
MSSLALNPDLDEANLNQYDRLNWLVQVETGTTTHVWDGSNLVMELTGDTVTGKYLWGIRWGGNTGVSVCTVPGTLGVGIDYVQV